MNGTHALVLGGLALFLAGDRVQYFFKNRAKKNPAIAVQYNTDDYVRDDMIDPTLFNPDYWNQDAAGASNLVSPSYVIDYEFATGRADPNLEHPFFDPLSWVKTHFGLILTTL